MLIDPYIGLVDSSPVDGSPLPVHVVESFTALQPSPRVLRLSPRKIWEYHLKNLTEVRKAAFLHPSGGLLPLRAMKVEEVGELELIKKIARKFRRRYPPVVLGAGDDDCAVLECGELLRKYLVVTTDGMRASTHFPEGMTPFQMGWSVVAANLSDIAAMGARPFAFTVAMGIPPNTESSFVEEIAGGMESCAERFDVFVVGGDVVRSDELTLVGTCLGVVDKRKLVKRSGASVDDLVCVTGNLGNAALGLELLKGIVMSSLPQSVEKVAKKALLEPVPRVKEGIALAETGVVTSMMDVSDGLAKSLHELSRSSSVGFEIHAERIPVLKELREVLGEKALELALYCGGDYELLFTVRRDGMDALKEVGKAIGTKISVIGKVKRLNEGIYIRNGRREEIKLRGYLHFGATP